MNLGSMFPKVVGRLEAPGQEIVEILQQEAFDCHHADSEWSAVNTKMHMAFEKDFTTLEPIYTPVVIQWCRQCKCHEILTHKEYAERRTEEGKDVPAWCHPEECE